MSKRKAAGQPKEGVRPAPSVVRDESSRSGSSLARPSVSGCKKSRRKQSEVTQVLGDATASTRSIRHKIKCIFKEFSAPSSKPVSALRPQAAGATPAAPQRALLPPPTQKKHCRPRSRGAQGVLPRRAPFAH